MKMQILSVVLALALSVSPPLGARDDPMEQALVKAERDARQNSFLSTTFTRYPGKLGTAYFLSQGGTPHGFSSRLVYVSPDGTETNISSLLPEGYVYGSIWYLPAKEIQFDETGERLSFVVDVRELEDDGMNIRKNWGDTRITVNVVTGAVESMEPVVPFDLTEWSIASEPDFPLSNPSPALNIVIKNDTLESVSTRPYIESSSYPDADMSAAVSQDGVRIVHHASCILDPEFLNSGYGKAYCALQEPKLPSVVQENFSPGNTPEQRERAGQYFRVLLNGVPVPGNLWWSQGNNHRDLNFTFDQPVELKEGDALTVYAGLPQT